MLSCFLAFSFFGLPFIDVCTFEEVAPYFSLFRSVGRISLNVGTSWVGAVCLIPEKAQRWGLHRAPSAHIDSCETVSVFCGQQLVIVQVAVLYRVIVILRNESWYSLPLLFWGEVLARWKFLGPDLALHLKHQQLHSPMIRTYGNHHNTWIVGA